MYLIAFRKYSWVAMKIMFTNYRYEIHNRPKMETTKIHLQESMNFIDVTWRTTGENYYQQSNNPGTRNGTKTVISPKVISSLSHK